jgi:hypothetical protein
MDTIGKIFTGVIMLIIYIIISGFLLMKTWAWFIVPVFTSVPKLTFAQSVGISIFLSIFITKRDNKEYEFDELVDKFFNDLIITSMLFLLAWIVYIFIQ